MSCRDLRRRPLLAAGLGLASIAPVTAQSSWSTLNPASGPGYRAAAAAASGFNTVWMFGGASAAGFYADTWGWDGDDWHQRLPAALPPARSGAVFATDLTQGKPLLFGGNRLSPSLQWFGGTHLFTAAAPAATPFGGGCAGSAGTPTLGSAPSPFLGSPWSTYVADVPLNAPLFLAIGLSNAAWGTAALPLDLTVLGMNGCDLLISPDLLLFAPPQAATAVTVPIALPNDALLAGQTIYVQAMVLDAAANPFGATLTGAVAAHLALP